MSEFDTTYRVAPVADEEIRTVNDMIRASVNDPADEKPASEVATFTPEEAL